MRDRFNKDEFALAIRTKRAAQVVIEKLELAGKDSGEAALVARASLEALNFKVNDETDDDGVVLPGKTDYLIFLADSEFDAIAKICLENWESLVGTIGDVDGKSSRKKGQARTSIPNNVVNSMKSCLKSVTDAPDLALFGRMLADMPGKNIDGASQVAHSLSTNRVSMEFDYYTAIDDLQPLDNQGADMIGSIGFNSSCFYRYMNVDFGQLLSNLDGNRDRAIRTLRAFIRASIEAIPTGKQNSMAAHNPPSYILVSLREGSPWNLANAFVQPIGNRNGDLITNSIQAMTGYWDRLASIYGSSGMIGSWVLDVDDRGQAPVSNTVELGTLDELVEAVATTANDSM